MDQAQKSRLQGDSYHLESPSRDSTWYDNVLQDVM